MNNHNSSGTNSSKRTSNSSKNTSSSSSKSSRTSSSSRSGIGPSSFSKEELLKIITLQVNNGKKTRRSFDNVNPSDVSRTTLVNEAKRVRTPNTWAYYYNLFKK